MFQFVKTFSLFSNGVNRCGIYIAANVCIDQMDMDHEVDVFHAVKLIRMNRPQLVDRVRSQLLIMQSCSYYSLELSELTIS